MSVQITEAMVRQYSANFEHLFQQTTSELQNTVRNEPQEAEFKFWDFIGPVEALDDPARHADTTYVTTPHSRRRNTLRKSWYADLVDDADKIQTLKDPTNDYVTAGVASLKVKTDRRIIEALGGVAYSGKDGSTSINVYDAGESRLIDGIGTLVAAGSNHSDTAETGLTLAKIGMIGKLLDDGKAPKGNRHLLANHANKWFLLGSTKATSSDYNAVKNLTRGEIDEYLGFTFHWLSDDMFTANATDTGCYECYAWHKSAVLLGQAKAITTSIDPLPTKHFSVQVYASMMLGATRLQGPGVVKFLLDKDPAIDFSQE